MSRLFHCHGCPFITAVPVSNLLLYQGCPLMKAVTLMGLTLYQNRFCNETDVKCLSVEEK